MESTTSGFTGDDSKIPPPVSRIKAIPTKYLGTTYRSRLEAKWAVFFHALEIAFDYEAQSLKLEDGTPYMPDLYFPQIRYFAEIKPCDFTEDERRKCLEVVKGTGRPIILLVRQPGFCTYEVVKRTDIADDPRPVLESFDCLLDIDAHGRRLYRDQRRFFCDTQGQWKDRRDFTQRYQEAVDLARDARFDQSGRW